MAKADDTTSTDWILLCEALRHVQAAVGSRGLAEIKLRRWLATGELPWTCRSWAGRQKYVRTEEGKLSVAPDDRVSNGDPLFWPTADTNWDGSSACEASLPLGARAQGIYVPRARLLELLSGGTRGEERARARGIKVLRLGLLDEEPPGGTRKRKKAGPQQRRVLPVLKKLYPPDGKVPDDVPTETVKGRVNDELAPENERLGLREASWDSVNRALGRDPRYR